MHGGPELNLLRANTRPEEDAMAEQASDTGMNRTGIEASPFESKGMLENAGDQPVPSADDLAMTRERKAWIRVAAPVGKVPPPMTGKGLLTVAKETLKGNKPTVFVNRLGERLGFERAGVRLYDAVLAKFDEAKAWDGGPMREELVRHRREEWEHLLLLKETIEVLGADPTTMTPAADLAALASEGVVKVIADPRAGLAESLDALLIAERADNDGWELLVSLAKEIGQNSLADRFQAALEEERRHAAHVKTWVAAAATAEVRRELGH